MARLLIVEDDAGTSALVCRGLAEAGHDVEAAVDGANGLDRLLNGAAFDLVVLDAVMPQRDGWHVLSEMRRLGMETPVLMLSALEGVEHRVRGLSLGADDYISKPFSFEELSLRVEAICRRLARVSERPSAFADLRLDERRLIAIRGEIEIPLSAKEYALLDLLVAHHGSVLSKAFIARHVWDMQLDSESNIVEVNIRRLRQKIDDPYPRKLIHTMRGRGYVLR